MRALASHQCGPGLIPRLGVICGLSLLLVLVCAERVTINNTHCYLLLLNCEKKMHRYRQFSFCISIALAKIIFSRMVINDTTPILGVNVLNLGNHVLKHLFYEWMSKCLNAC